MSAATPIRTRSAPAHEAEPPKTTLLELVRAVGEVTEDEDEVVATVLHMLRSGSVQLSGSFRDEPIRSFLR